VLAGLSYLTLQHSVNEGEAEQAAQLLAKCRHLRNLRGLSLTFALGDDACQALASAPWEELEWFAPDCSQITPDGLRALAGASWFRRLRDLSLDGGLPDLTFEELTRLPTFPRLHTLDLSRNQFAEAGWLAFTNTRTFPKLTRLELEESDMGWHMISLLQATGFKLSVLNAPRCGVGLGAGAELAASPWAKSLRILNLSTNAIDPSDVKAITSCKRFTELRHLDLSYNGISPTGLSSLSANPALRELRSLNLAGRPSDNGGLASAHFDRFLSKLDMPELRHLDLSGRPLGPKAARKLADPKFASLTRLGLQGCKLTDPAVAALVASPALANLIQLGLNDNRLSTGLEKLTDRSVLPRLASCTLGGNSIPPALARKLRRRPGVRI
jgi:Leucine-rich repeat (LRR) protein